MKISLSKIKSVVRFALPILLGVALLWWLYRDIDWADVQSIVQHQLDYGVLSFSLLFGLAANVVRGLRWHLLIMPLVQGEPKPKLANAVATVLGSYTINMVIPRAGELWRCAEYKRRESVSFSSLVGTLISDRLTDVLCLGLILVAVVGLNTQFFFDLVLKGRDWSAMLHSWSQSPWLYLGLVLAIAASGGGLWFVRRYPDNRISQTLRSVCLGLVSIRKMPQIGRFLAYSLLIWVGYFGFFYTSFFAFPFTNHLPINVGFVAFAMSALSVLAPVQNGMGAWHWVVIATLVFYGVAEPDAKTFALIVHLVQTLWITLVGLVAIVALPIINRGYQRITNATT